MHTCTVIIFTISFAGVVWWRRGRGGEDTMFDTKLWFMKNLYFSQYRVPQCLSSIFHKHPDLTNLPPLSDYHRHTLCFFLVWCIAENILVQEPVAGRRRYRDSHATQHEQARLRKRTGCASFSGSARLLRTRLRCIAVASLRPIHTLPQRWVWTEGLNLPLRLGQACCRLT